MTTKYYSVDKDLEASESLMDDLHLNEWDDKTIRMGFLRKVFGIVLLSIAFRILRTNLLEQI